MAATGAFALILHAHLPYVRHPEFATFMEEEWLFEAITETYLPLLEVFEQLVADGLPLRVTMTLSPPLCEMLADELLQQRYAHHLDNLLHLMEAELKRTHGTPLELAAQLYHRTLKRQSERYHADRCELLPRFKALQDSGHLEIVTCCATHGFLPLMETEEAIRAQLFVAVQSYARHFGCRPRGIWLAECAYRPGLEGLLEEVGLRYFFVDTHGLTHAEPPPIFGTAAPLVLSNGVAAFARDPQSSAQVWSAETGYPGNPVYREFYRDLGWDLPMDYLQQFVLADGIRRNLGIKYHRITGKVGLGQKKPYVPSIARVQALKDAGHFLSARQSQVQKIHDDWRQRGIDRVGSPGHDSRRLPLILSPYDAELYGHWWFEGPWFLESFLRLTLETQDQLQLTTPAEYLERFPRQQQATLQLSSWGANGYGEVWLNPKNAWIYPHLHAAERRMVAAARQHRWAEGWVRRLLNQAARELLLAQSSDWAFIITQNTTVPYAEKRTREHLTWFNRLLDQLDAQAPDLTFLAELEGRNPIFPTLDFRIYGR